MEKGHFNIIVQRYFQNKYWILGSVVSCVLVAFIYLTNVVPQYRVSTSIKLTKSNPISQGRFNELIQQVRLKTSIERAVKQLSLQTLYTQRQGFEITGLYGSQLPVEIVFDGQYNSTSDASLKVSITGNNSLEIEDNDKTTTLAFNEFVSKPYGRFKIIKGPSFQSNKNPVNIDLFTAGHLTEQYWQNLVITPGNQDDKAITFSVLDITTDRGFDLINQIISNYNDKAESANRMLDEPDPQINDSITTLSTQLSALKVKYALLQIKDKKAVNPVPNDKAKKHSFNDQQQLNIYDVIAPYLKTSVNQFGLVPYSEEIQDIAIRKSVDRYNEIQTLKQSKLRDVKANDPAIIDFNKQLSSLQKNIVTAIDQRKADIKTGVQALPVVKNLVNNSIKDSIKSVANAVLLKTNIYEALISKADRANSNVDARLRLIVDQRIINRQPEYPKYWLTYLFAFILGLIPPLFVPYLIPNLKNLSSDKISEVTNIKKITGVPCYNALEDLIPALLSEPSIQSFLITSGADNVQKALVIKAIATDLSSHGKRVIVIDLNLREPGLLKNFDIQDKTGVIEFLNAEITEVEKLIIPSKTNKNLYFIGAGMSVAENADPVSSFFSNNELASPWADENQLDKLVNDPRIGVLIQELRSKFDYIMFDSPSIIHPADLFPLVEFSDVQFILMGINATKKQVANIEDLYQRNRFDNPVIFNLTW